MDEQNRDHFYEGPPLEEAESWHEGAVVGERDVEQRAERPPGEAADRSAPAADRSAQASDRSAQASDRPAQASDRPAQATRTVNRDPSLSRAVDREAEGLDAEAAGYDRAIEGPSPGPLEPSADERPADAPEMPGGEYGSSG